MTLRMRIRIPFGGDALCDALEMDYRYEIEAELDRRGLGVSWGGLTGPGQTSIDFEFNDPSESHARQHIASVVMKIAPGLVYCAEPSNYPPRSEDYEQ